MVAHWYNPSTVKTELGFHKVRLVNIVKFHYRFWYRVSLEG